MNPICAIAQQPVAVLPATKPLSMTGDITSELVSGVDRFLSREIAESEAKRTAFWKRDFSTVAAYEASVEPNRRRLAQILGVRDPRAAADNPDVWKSACTANWDRIRWPAFGDVTGEGLESRSKSSSLLIVIPDADVTPEQIAGLAPGLPPESQVARRLMERGEHVIVLTLLDRTVAPRNGRARLTNREFIYRSAFELGRHVIGYEIQKVLALVDRHCAAGGVAPGRVGIFGHGEGGAIALHAAALDRRIAALCVSGYFDDRRGVWRQPVDRNVFGLLERFGDAEVASLVAPRALIVEAARGPEIVLPPGSGGAPGRLTTPRVEAVRAEVDRARKLVAGLEPPPRIELVESGPDGAGPYGTTPALEKWLAALSGQPSASVPEVSRPSTQVDDLDRWVAARQQRLLHELDRHNQRLLVESAGVRRTYMKNVDTSTLDNFTNTIEPYREQFARDVIGRFERPLSPPDVRSRRLFDEPAYTGYEVVMDVFPDVIAYGILLLPKGIKSGEKRPVVVCQHGLEGRPRDVADPRVDGPYHKYAVRLAERGFITFAPQNLYIFQDRFRTLQRKANPVGKTLFSVIIPQHQQITDWLKTLPEVDPTRVAFYGLSYGGKSAMRIPPLVKNYCLSICSADFNEWVWKNASTESPYSYVWTGEYEIFEFDLGSTFNYAEMAALIAPRPFMVERGHFDGVSSDEAVAYEFAKVFNLYDARLKIGDRCEMEVFVGPHEINGKGTFEFLHRWLEWPKPSGK
jgi:dienelactone hydrolase